MSRLWNRRRWLEATAALSAVRFAAPADRVVAGGVGASDRACILVYLDGGASHIDLLDLKPEAPAEVRGPYRPIASTVPGVEIGELLPHIARQMHHAVLVRSMRHAETVHDPAVYQMLTGYKHPSNAGGLKVEETDLPHMASAFERACAVTGPAPGGMPRAIELPETMHMQGRILPGQNAGVLGQAFDPFRVRVEPNGIVTPPPFARAPEIADTRYRNRSRLLRGLDTSSAPHGDAAEASHGRWDLFRDQALALLERPEIARAFDLDSEPATLRDRYGHHRHGRSMLLARRLVEAGSRFVTVYWGREPQDMGGGKGPVEANNPWDTHRNHFPLLQQSLCPRADQSLAALLEDLTQRGLLENTLVVWMGDFGRTPRISKPWASRDHWPHAFSLLLAGGGLEGGRVIGRTDRTASEVLEDAMSPADLTATIFERLGVDPRRSIPTARGGGHRLSEGRVPVGLRG